MKVKIDSDVYFVHWNHDTHKNEENNGITTCFIRKLNNDTDTIDTIVVDDAVCSKLDKYNKHIGRKISLTRAMDVAFFEDRESRKIFWNQYHKEMGI